jgi:hypothetical protein
LSHGIGNLAGLFQGAHGALGGTGGRPNSTGRVQLIREVRIELIMRKVQVRQSVADKEMKDILESIKYHYGNMSHDDAPSFISSSCS